MDQNLRSFDTLSTQEQFPDTVLVVISRWQEAFVNQISVARHKTYILRQKSQVLKQARQHQFQTTVDM